MRYTVSLDEKEGRYTDMKMLEMVLDDENLERAVQKVIRAKGTYGIDKMSTSELRNWLKENKEQLKTQIRTRKYKPQPVRRVEIPKEDGSKRMLGIPTVVDRMIQQAMVQVMSPIFEDQFSEYSYGFRPKRNAHMAIEHTLECINQGKQWIVDIDLEKFFDKVHHDKLMQIVSDTINDGDVVSLIRKYLVSGIMIDEEFKESVIGTPQGGNLSPLLGNIILDKLDKELESRGLSFARYADDCLIFVGTLKAANRVMKNVTRFLEEELKLKVNITKSRISKPENVKFLGFVFNRGYDYLFKAKPHQLSIQKLKDKIRRITSRRWSTDMDTRLLKLKQLFRGWFHYFKHKQIKTLLISMDRFTRVRLRMCIWKQWKKIKTRYKALIKLGIPSKKAWEWANTRKGYARVAMSFIMTRSVTNLVLEKRGFLTMESLYNQAFMI